MPPIDLNSAAILLGITLMVIEIVIGAIDGFELFVLGVILIIAGLIGMIVGSPIAMIITFVVLTLAYTFVGRKYIKERLTVATKKTNADALIGKNALVLSPIEPQKPGRVRVESEDWRAESDEKIQKGDTVKVVSISGVTLKVKNITNFSK